MGFLDVLFSLTDFASAIEKNVSAFSKFQNCTDEVYDEIITGHFSLAKEKVANVVLKYLQRGYKVKIGITNRPCGRFKEHNYDNSNGYGSQKDQNVTWKKMIVIYESNTADYTRKMESYLIEQFSSKVENTISGGGGGIGSGKQYVYILLR